MPSSTRENERWRLDAPSFQSLLERLGSDPAQAGARYEMLRGRLILFFSRRLLHAPEDLTDEVIDRLARRLRGGEPVASIEAYALGIANHVAQEQRAAEMREVDAGDFPFENISAFPATPEREKLQHERRLDAMERCLARISRADAELLTSYYLVEGGSKIQSRREMAERMNLTQAALRKRVFQICWALREAIRRHSAH
jgi:DNA-directed RNA polymerase specialized sigma24 family protein